VAGADDENVERGFGHGRHYTLRNAECGVRSERRQQTTNGNDQERNAVSRIVMFSRETTCHGVVPARGV
jgi:hypothetical protein